MVTDTVTDLRALKPEVRVRARRVPPLVFPMQFFALDSTTKRDVRGEKPCCRGASPSPSPAKNTQTQVSSPATSHKAHSQLTYKQNVSILFG
jgi:hypothetical protein